MEASSINGCYSFHIAADCCLILSIDFLDCLLISYKFYLNILTCVDNDMMNEILINANNKEVLKWKKN